MELQYFPIYYLKRLFYNILTTLSSTHVRHGFVQFNERKQIQLLNICVSEKTLNKSVFTMPPS